MITKTTATKNNLSKTTKNINKPKKNKKNLTTRNQQKPKVMPKMRTNVLKSHIKPSTHKTKIQTKTQAKSEKRN